MKYLVATFTIETTADLMQACQDLLADGAAEAGFESFEETETGLEAYVQKELFDKEMLDAYIADFPIEDTKITYEVKDAEDKDWNQEWEEQGFEPIYVDNQVVIYDALSVMPEAQQEARPIMHFHLHALIRWELDVMIARLFMRRDRADKGDDSFVFPFHPDINITRRTGIRIRIHQCIPLPFQNTGSESLFPEPLRNMNGSIVQPDIRFLQHLAFRHPLK